jgi:general stress protein 26
MPNPSAPHRPDFPSGYGIATSTDGLLEWPYVVDQLTRARNYWVVTASVAGRPHAAPVWGLWLDDTFVFSSDPTARKTRNLADRPEVMVHLESGDDVVILEGRATRVTDRDLLRRFVTDYKAKYDIEVDADNPEYGVYQVKPETAMAWLEKDFPKTATRWRFAPRR